MNKISTKAIKRDLHTAITLSFAPFASIGRYQKDGRIPFFKINQSLLDQWVLLGPLAPRQKELPMTADIHNNVKACCFVGVVINQRWK